MFRDVYRMVTCSRSAPCPREYATISQPQTPAAAAHVLRVLCMLRATPQSSSTHALLQHHRGYSAQPGTEVASRSADGASYSDKP